MARNKLTDSQARAATRKIGDGDGLWLYVSRTGSKSWVFIFVRGGRRREMGLGAFGAGTGQVSLAQARVKADEIRSLLGAGRDPFVDMVERQVQSSRKTFAAVVDDFLRANESGWRNEKHRQQWRMTLGARYCSSIIRRFVDEIETDEVVAVVAPIWETKPETASRLRARIERILDFARVEGLREGENPARWRGHLEHRLGRARKLTRGHHPAMPYAELPAFLQRLRAVPGVGARALEFTILTAARTGETTLASWPEFDLDEKTWTVPGARMKAGRDHRVALSDRAVAVLRRQQEISQNEFVFPGAKRGRPISNMTMTKALAAAGGASYTVHGMRSAFRDWCGEETSFPDAIAEAALAHIVGDETERAYRRGDALEKRRRLMSAWASYLDKPAAPVGATIIQLRAS